ncbi:hypothetical protein ACHAWF_018217 [Thalassiosira exigua]
MATGINGRPVAISPRAAAHPSPIMVDGHPEAGGVLASLFCDGPSSFLPCDGSPRPDEVDFDINPTGVYVAVHTKQWELARERVKIYPREAATWVARYGSGGSGGSGDSGGIPDAAAGTSSFGERIAATSPRSAGTAPPPPLHPLSPRGGGGGNGGGPKVLRWRMLPLHAAMLFGAPPDVVKALIKAHPAGCSARDDQGSLPLHLAFRSGASEEMVLLLLDAYPQAIERSDNKGRLPSMLAPRQTMSYGDLLGEAFVKGPAYYYWASRVASADRARGEAALTRRIHVLEEQLRAAGERSREALETTERRLEGELEALSSENGELKARLDWYETKYDGADEKERVLVDHANSLAERLRLTSLSEEHLATKLARLEAKLKSRDVELEEARKAAAGEQLASAERVAALEKALERAERQSQSLAEDLARRSADAEEARKRFEKERRLFERQIDASKECLMELIASSKEDKRMFEEDSRELRRQLQALQSDLRKASASEKRMFAEESQELKRQLATIQSDVQRATGVGGSGGEAAARELEAKLERLHREVTGEARSFESRVGAGAHRGRRRSSRSPARDAEGSGSFGTEREATGARAIGRRGIGTSQTDDAVRPDASGIVASNVRHSNSVSPGSNAQRSGSLSPRTNAAPKSMKPRQPFQEEDPFAFDTYVSTKSSRRSGARQARDDDDCYSHPSDVVTALALGELTEEQRLALERLDLGGSREEITAMLSRVPGLTENQVKLLVDVASSITG